MHPKNPYDPRTDFAQWNHWRVHYEPICECGDYRDEHENGTGECSICAHAGDTWSHCQRFRHVPCFWY